MFIFNWVNWLARAECARLLSYI